MIVTTSNRHQQELEPLADQIALDLELPFIKRGRYSIAGLFREYQLERLLVVSQEELKLFSKEDLDAPFFFHPSSAMFRIKRLQKEGLDPFVQAAQLKPGISVLDCTLGLASDAIVASYACQPTSVTGLESTKIVAYIVQRGLRSWNTKLEELELAMKGIKVIHQSYQEYLQKSPDNSFDVVYFDPMFEKGNHLSTNLTPLKKMANYEKLTSHTISEARRVARKRVVYKDSSYSPAFEALGFSPLVRKYASHWYGVINLEE